MFKNLKIARKVNSILLISLVIGLSLSSVVLIEVLKEKTEKETIYKAELLLSTMLSVRNYTTEQINPILAPQLKEITKFLPQTVPSYSAHKIFQSLKENPNYKNYSYKEATINPTNLKDIANNFETKLIEDFRQNPNKNKTTGYINNPIKLFYIARPIQIKKASCLVCHSLPEAAPTSMINSYGTENGFGWKLNEIVGTQVIYVPSEKLVSETLGSVTIVLTTILVAFSIALFTINNLIKNTIVKPLNRLIIVAEKISEGNMNVELTEVKSNDEIGILSRTFIRMKRSLELSINMLKKDYS